MNFRTPENLRIFWSSFFVCSWTEFVLFCRTKENQKGRRCPQSMKAPVGLLSRRPVCEANAACSARQGHSDFDALQPGVDCSLLAPKENQKGRRCPEGMKAPVGLLSRRPVCEANAACSARQGHSDFEALQPGGVCSLLPHKREPEKRQRFRRAGPTNQGLLALDNPKAEVEAEKC